VTRLNLQLVATEDGWVSLTWYSTGIKLMPGLMLGGMEEDMELTSIGVSVFRSSATPLVPLGEL